MQPITPRRPFRRPLAKGRGPAQETHLARGRGDATDKPEEASRRLLADELVSLNFFVFLGK